MERKGFKDMEESIQEAYQNKREEYNASLAKREEAIRQAFVLKVVTLISCCFNLLNGKLK